LIDLLKVYFNAVEKEQTTFFSFILQVCKTERLSMFDPVNDSGEGGNKRLPLSRNSNDLY